MERERRVSSWKKNNKSPLEGRGVFYDFKIFMGKENLEVRLKVIDGPKRNYVHLSSIMRIGILRFGGLAVHT